MTDHGHTGADGADPIRRTLGATNGDERSGEIISTDEETIKNLIDTLDLPSNDGDNVFYEGRTNKVAAATGSAVPQGSGGGGGGNGRAMPGYAIGIVSAAAALLVLLAAIVLVKRKRRNASKEIEVEDDDTLSGELRLCY